MSLRKAQKHMQRATELLDQSQLEFGTGDKKPGVETREMKRQIKELEKQKKIRAKRPKRCIRGEFSPQIQGVCYMYSVYNLVLRMLLKDPALNSLKSVIRANKQLESGSVLRVGRHTLEPEALILYDSLEIYWTKKSLWDRSPNRSDCEEPKLLPSLNIPAYDIPAGTAGQTEGGCAPNVLQAIILSTKEHNEL